MDIGGTDRIIWLLGAGHPGRQSGLTVLAKVAFENLEVRVGDVARADDGVERGRGRRDEWAGNRRGSENLESEGGEKVGCFGKAIEIGGGGIGSQKKVESRTEVVSWPSQYFPGEKQSGSRRRFAQAQNTEYSAAMYRVKKCSKRTVNWIKAKKNEHV